MREFLGVRARYDVQGHVTVRGVVDPDTVAAAHEHLAGLRARPGGSTPGGIVAAPLDDPFFRTVTRHPDVVRLVSSLLGMWPEPFACTYIVKEPRVGLPALWHQDGYPWRRQIGRREALTVWLALDEVTADNGCLRVVPGSHRLPEQPLRPNEDTPSVFGGEIDPALVDESRAVDVLLAPGDVSIHHPALVHGSGPNRSDRPRAALALRFVASLIPAQA